MKYTNMSALYSRKKPLGKAILIIVVIFLATSYIFTIGADLSDINHKSIKGSEESNQDKEENEFAFEDVKFYASIGITSSQLPEQNIMLYTSCFIGIFLITDVAMVVKRQNKAAKSESGKNSVNNERVNSQECLVLELVQEYLSRNRYLEIEKVGPFISARLSKSDSLNKNGIDAILAKLLKKNLIVEGSKYTYEDILNNENRLTIYEMILTNPGIHFMNIVNSLGMSIFLVKWHLAMLIKFNLIKNEEVENRQIYFDSRIPTKKAKQLHFASRERSVKILNFLKKEKEACPKYRISKILHMHPNTVTKYINKLEAIGLVNRTQSQKKTLFSSNPYKHL